MLLLLQLVMGMQDTLGTEILSKPEQIIAFASNVLCDYAGRLEEARQRQYSKKKTSSSIVDIANIVTDEDREAMENTPTEEDIRNDLESLILSINLLRAVMHGKMTYQCFTLYLSNYWIQKMTNCLCRRVIHWKAPSLL